MTRNFKRRRGSSHWYGVESRGRLPMILANPPHISFMYIYVLCTVYIYMDYIYIYVLYIYIHSNIITHIIYIDTHTNDVYIYIYTHMYSFMQMYQIWGCSRCPHRNPLWKPSMPTPRLRRVVGSRKSYCKTIHW